MPELPDIEAYLFALRQRMLNQRLERVRLGSPFLLRTVEPPVTAAEGHLVTDLRRIGKRIAIGFDNDVWLVFHLMIAGRLHWREPNAKLIPRRTLAALDFAGGTLTLTEAGSKRRASLHVVRGEQALAALDPGGIDVLTASFDEFKARLKAENHTLKRALTDPRTLSGIGNAYSDEILHAAQLSPIAQTGKLTEAQWHALHRATIQTLELWRDRFVAEAAKNFPEKVTAFRPNMAVHGRFNQPCPTCAAPIQRIRYADNETNYCPTCQTEGKLLADRSLSRLLGKDWPKTLDALELLKRK
jgi:formamidopyrimidine-DNA glycosylase